jgi:hypothetical protein
MFAERQSRRLVGLRGFLEQSQALRESAGLHCDPCAARGNHGDDSRADLSRFSQRLVQSAQCLTVAALLGLDQRQIVPAKHRASRRDPRVRHHAPTDLGSLVEPPFLIRRAR